MQDSMQNQVPLLGIRKKNKLCSNPSFGFAISGWLLAAAVSCAYFVDFGKSVDNVGINGGEVPSHHRALPSQLAEVSGNGVNAHTLLINLIFAAGCGQISLVVASFAIPFLLDYKKMLDSGENEEDATEKKRKKLIADMFLVYSGYILTINFGFGLVSAFAPESILVVNFQSSIIAGFICLYWFARLMVAIFVFDLSFLVRPHEICGRVGIEILFGILPVIYGLAFAYDIGKLSLDFIVPDIGPFGRMLFIIIALFMTIKVCAVMITTQEFKKAKKPTLTWGQTFLFFFLWPGMDPEPWLERKSGLNWCNDAKWGTGFVILGFVWSVGIKYGHDHADWSPAFSGLLSLPGISMMFHVGGLRLLRGFVRLLGYDVEKLFDDPLFATSMSSFWAHRWNKAFADMNRIVFVNAAKTALTEDLGLNKEKAELAGVFFAFVCSALLHELGITVPVLAGFGGPTVYFLIQGFGVMVEKLPKVNAWRKKNGTAARLMAWVVIALPFPICFVVPFRTEIAFPLTMMIANLPMNILGFLQDGFASQ